MVAIMSRNHSPLPRLFLLVTACCRVAGAVEPIPVPLPLPASTSGGSSSRSSVDAPSEPLMASDSEAQASYARPDELVGFPSLADAWPAPQPELPHVTHLDVQCSRSTMKVRVEFDKPFHGLIFSKGHYSQCVHLPSGSGLLVANFDISAGSCGTMGDGSFFENTIVVQYDPQVQEAWDLARKLRCTWHDQYEKAVTFRPFPVDMLEVIRADFAGDNVGCWMQVQVGKGPWANEVSGIVKIGQTMTMVLAIQDEENKFDMMVRNCIAHDGKRAPIELVDGAGCVTRPKLMSRFTKVRNFGSSASVLSFAHLQAFKFPDSMEVHFQCTIQICRPHCPEQCPAVGSNSIQGRPRQERDLSVRREMTEVGVTRAIRVVGSGDLDFDPADDNGPKSRLMEPRPTVCMSTAAVACSFSVLVALALAASVAALRLALARRHRPAKIDEAFDSSFN